MLLKREGILSIRNTHYRMISSPSSLFYFSFSFLYHYVMSLAQLSLIFPQVGLYRTSALIWSPLFVKHQPGTYITTEVTLISWKCDKSGRWSSFMLWFSAELLGPSSRLFKLTNGQPCRCRSLNIPVLHSNHPSNIIQLRHFKKKKKSKVCNMPYWMCILGLIPQRLLFQKQVMWASLGWYHNSWECAKSCARRSVCVCVCVCL